MGEAKRNVAYKKNFKACPVLSGVVAVPGDPGSKLVKPGTMLIDIRNVPIPCQKENCIAYVPANSDETVGNEPYCRALKMYLGP